MNGNGTLAVTRSCAYADATNIPAKTTASIDDFLMALINDPCSRTALTPCDEARAVPRLHERRRSSNGMRADEFLWRD
jgi:hypothetical protein